MLNPLPLLRFALRPLFVLCVNYVRRLSRSTVAIIGAVVLGLGAMVLLFFKANPLGENDANFYDSLDADQTGLFFLGNIYNVDIPSRIVSVSWLIGACGDLRSTTWYQHHACTAPKIPVAVYINGASRPTFKYDPNLQPQTNQSGLMSAPYVQALDEYQTTHFLDVYTQFLKIKNIQINMDQSYNYPFDNFYMETQIVAINTSDTNFSAIPINSIGFAGYSNSWVPYVTNTASTTLFNGTTVTSRYAYLTLKRTNVSKSFVIIVFVVNWGLTLMVVSVTMVALFAKNLRIPDGIVVLPVSVILTLSGLRALFVDSPPSCILLDIIGIFFQMTIVSVCSIALIAKIILKSFKLAKQGESNQD